MIENHDKYIPVIRVDQQIYCEDKDAEGKRKFFFVKVFVHLHLNDIVHYWDMHSEKGSIRWNGDVYPNWDSYFAKIIFEETMLAVYNVVIGHISGSGDVVTVSMDRSYSLAWVEMAMSLERWDELKQEQKYDTVNNDFLVSIR